MTANSRMMLLPLALSLTVGLDYQQGSPMWAEVEFCQFLGQVQVCAVYISGVNVARVLSAQQLEAISHRIQVRLLREVGHLP